MASPKWSDYPLDEMIIKSLEENELDYPLPIQVKTLDAALNHDKHVMGAAQTGSGKTLAYVIPVIYRILKYRKNPCSYLKKRICKSNRTKEDFDLIDGETVSIEDMIVDNIRDDIVDDSDEEFEDDNLNCAPDSKLLDNLSCPEAIILVPTRELALQVKDEIEKICKNCAITTCCIIGGLSQDKQVRILRRKRPEIIVATPGRLYDMVSSNEIEHINLSSIASIRTLVIDEADRMVQKGHFEELLKLIDIVKESTRFRDEHFSFRVYLFSATLTFIHELPDRLRSSKLKKISENNRSRQKKPKINAVDQSKANKINQMLYLFGISKEETEVIDLNIDSTHGKPNSEQLSEFKINCLANEKDLYLYYFLVMNKNKRTLVFCNSKDCLRRLLNVTKYLEINSLQLHADMDQKQRMKNMEKFRKNQGSILIATDIAARGLDVKNLESVIHYQVPKTCESYIHRSGRTARLSENGVSLTLCEPKEIQYYKRICNQINNGKNINDYEIDVHLKTLLSARVKLAQQCDKIDHHLREVNSSTNWYVKAANDAEIELDDDDLSKLIGRGKFREEQQQADAKNRRRLNLLRKQLTGLLKKPLVHQGRNLVE